MLRHLLQQTANSLERLPDMKPLLDIPDPGGNRMDHGNVQVLFQRDHIGSDATSPIPGDKFHRRPDV